MERRAEVMRLSPPLTAIWRGVYQKVNFIPNWISRWDFVAFSVPNAGFCGLPKFDCVALPWKFNAVMKPTKFGWLNRLKTSVRNWRPYRSLYRQFLFTEKSTVEIAFPRIAPFPRLPSCPGAGNANAAG